MITGHDLVLHVGMPKASAILGPALRQLRPQLRAHGVAYVDGAQLGDLPHAAGWNRDPFTDHEQSTGFGRELADVARVERQRAGSLWRRRRVPVVVVSDQLLGRGDIGRRDATRLRPHAAPSVRQVIKALSARKVQVVVHTQRQDRLLELAYLQWLRSGQDATIGEYFPLGSAPVLDYGDLVTRLRSVPHVSDVVVRPVELADAGVRAFVNDALGAIGLRDALDLQVVSAELFVEPLVYSDRGAALARAMNPLVRGAELTLLQEFLSQGYAAQPEYGPPDILDPDARDDLLAGYAESNRSLFSEFMPDLPVDSYGSDTATFALGNVLRQPTPFNDTVTDRLASTASLRTSQASCALRGTAGHAAWRQRLGRLHRRL